MSSSVDLLLVLTLVTFSALIPLSEVSEASVMKKYGVKPDAETLDIANTAARQKSVKQAMISLFNSTCTNNP